MLAPPLSHGPAGPSPRSRLLRERSAPPRETSRTAVQAPPQGASDGLLHRRWLPQGKVRPPPSLGPRWPSASSTTFSSPCTHRRGGPTRRARNRRRPLSPPPEKSTRTPDPAFPPQPPGTLVRSKTCRPPSRPGSPQGKGAAVPKPRPSGLPEQRGPHAGAASERGPGERLPLPAYRLQVRLLVPDHRPVLAQDRRPPSPLNDRQRECGSGAGAGDCLPLPEARPSHHSDRGSAILQPAPSGVVGETREHSEQDRGGPLRGEGRSPSGSTASQKRVRSRQRFPDLPTLHKGLLQALPFDNHERPHRVLQRDSPAASMNAGCLPPPRWRQTPTPPQKKRTENQKRLVHSWSGIPLLPSGRGTKVPR